MSARGAEEPAIATELTAAAPSRRRLRNGPWLRAAVWMRRRRAGLTFLTIFALGELLLLGMLTRPVADYVDDNLQYELPGAEIQGAHTLGQTAIGRRPNLYAIDLVVATFARRNQGTLILHVKSAPQAAGDLRTVTVPMETLPDNATATFAFAPIADSLGREFYFLLEAPEATPGNAVTIWFARAHTGRGDRYVDGLASSGSLAFATRYHQRVMDDVPYLRRMSGDRFLGTDLAVLVVGVGYAYLVALAALIYSVARLPAADRT